MRSTRRARPPRMPARWISRAREALFWSRTSPPEPTSRCCTHNSDVTEQSQGCCSRPHAHSHSSSTRRFQRRAKLSPAWPTASWRRGTSRCTSSGPRRPCSRRPPTTTTTAARRPARATGRRVRGLRAGTRARRRRREKRREKSAWPPRERNAWRRRTPRGARRAKRASGVRPRPWRRRRQRRRRRAATAMTSQPRAPAVRSTSRI
mmetsp:Transcript_14600/g.36921  ORF Transcript_14600/g.36921 Transcript_14600/m.36921 type:complete len:206 (+) Transcript_14600:577-1194(+)